MCCIRDQEVYSKMPNYDPSMKESSDIFSLRVSRTTVLSPMSDVMRTVLHTVSLVLTGIGANACWTDGRKGEHRYNLHSPPL